MRSQKQMIKMVEEADSEGSDSNPSEDELGDEELIKIMPKNVLSNRQKQIMAEQETKAQKEQEKIIFNSPKKKAPKRQEGSI